MKLRRFLLFGVAFCLFIFWGQQLPITDPVESNYALTAKEMAYSNNWLSPKIYGQVWFDKPVMFYWLMGIAFKALGCSEMAARIIPALFGAGGVSLAEWFVTKIASPRQGLVTACLLATSLQYFMIAKLLIPDMVLFVLDSAALVFFFLGYFKDDGTKHWYLIMYPCLALAVLTKGPVGILLPGMIMVLFLGIQKNGSELKRMHLFSGMLVFSLIAFPWYIQMYLRHGDAFLNTFFGVNNYLRATVSEHPKDNVFYYYFVVFLLSTLPWTGFAMGGLYIGFSGLRHKNPQLSFFILWAIVYFVFYSFMATKYLTYTFPLLFPVVVLASFFLRAEEERILKRRNFTTLFPLLFLLVGSLVGGYKYIGQAMTSGLAVVSLGLLVVVWWQGKQRNTEKMLDMACLGVAIFYILLSLTAFPMIADQRSGKKISAKLVDSYYDNKIGMYNFYSTSAVFYSGNIMVRIDPPLNDSDGNTATADWMIKYTMPKSDLESFSKQSSKLMIIVPKNKQQQFAGEAAGLNYQLITSDKEYLFYQRLENENNR